MTPKENLHAFFEGKNYEWKPVGTDKKSFQPEEICEYVARAFVKQQEPFDNANKGGGIGWFGIEWKYEPGAGGSISLAPILDEVSEWKEKMVFPNLDEIDWEGIAARNADYVTDIVGIMDWYDGGGLDSCVLGMAEIDSTGNVNVTKFGSWTGPGGFINITNSAETNVFCGTMTAGGLKVAASDGRLEIVQEGKKKKFVNKVEQISFNALLAKQAGHSVIYITERAVFELTDEGLVLTEIAPGIDLETQILSQIDFDVKIAADLKEMDPRIFTDEPMGLSERGLSK